VTLRRRIPNIPATITSGRTFLQATMPQLETESVLGAGSIALAPPPETAAAARDTPEDSPLDVALVVDLDGTLLRGNVLIEQALVLLRSRPWALFRIPLWLLKGRAYLKQQLARSAPVDIASLPLNPAVERYAAAEKARGRKVYLATAADRATAEAIAARCGFFDGVLASDGEVNLKGRRKAAELDRTLPGRFAYAGDSRVDMPVWARASEAIYVGGARWARRMARRLGKPARIFAVPSRLPPLLRAARPHQWVKNTLVFVPAILGGRIFQPEVLGEISLAFAALCLIASGSYMLNDVWDVADDRRHWSKRHRPIASGDLPIVVALAACPCAIAAGFALGAAVGPAVERMLGVYLALTLLYSLVLKRIAVLDATALAALFTLRFMVGIAAAEVFASPWLLVFSMMLFASLCFAKRYVEVVGYALRGRNDVSYRGYQAEDAPLLASLGIAAGMSSIAILALYIVFDAFQRSFYGDTQWLWALPVILFLFVSRIWLMAVRGTLNDDPVAFAVADPQSLALGGAMVAAFLFAWSGTFG